MFYNFLFLTFSVLRSGPMHIYKFGVRGTEHDGKRLKKFFNFTTPNYRFNLCTVLFLVTFFVFFLNRLPQDLFFFLLFFPSGLILFELATISRFPMSFGFPWQFLFTLVLFVAMCYSDLHEIVFAWPLSCEVIVEMIHCDPAMKSINTVKGVSKVWVWITNCYKIKISWIRKVK